MASEKSGKTDLRGALSACGAAATPWFAVVDAAQGESAPERAKEAGRRTQSLYAGDLGARLDHVAPHLVSFDPKDAFADWFFAVWGGNHGILLQSKTSFEDLRKHFRKFLLVKNEAGKKFRFRFYDPRVLRSFLPNCTFHETTEFFGPVVRYYAESRSGEELLEFGMGPKELTVQEHVVEKPKPPQSGEGVGTSASRTRTGNLTVVLRDNESGSPLVGASVQVSGPVTKQAVSGEGGLIRFSKIEKGEYEVYAIDGQYRSGTGRISVGQDHAVLRLSCRALAGGSET